jgi:recombination DNA repair RAD52 pathway protein
MTNDKVLIAAILHNQSQARHWYKVALANKIFGAFKGWAEDMDISARYARDARLLLFQLIDGE